MKQDFLFYQNKIIFVLCLLIYLINNYYLFCNKCSPKSLSKYVFNTVCKLFTIFLKYDDLINEYQQFCFNFLELEKTIILPEYLHTLKTMNINMKNILIICYKI